MSEKSNGIFMMCKTYKVKTEFSVFNTTVFCFICRYCYEVFFAISISNHFYLFCLKELIFNCQHLKLNKTRMVNKT